MLAIRCATCDDEGLGRDTTERRLPIDQDRTLPRVFRTSDPPRTSSRVLMWIVLGGGFAASRRWSCACSAALRSAFRTARRADKPETPSARRNPAAEQDESSARPYVLEVVTEPAGARVSAERQSVIAPGELRFDHFQPPLLVTATLAGYPNATASVWPSHFTQKDDRYAGHLELRFEGAPKPVAAASAGHRQRRSRAGERARVTARARITQDA